MRRRRLWLLTVLVALAVAPPATAHPGAWESHSTYQRGGPAKADTMRGCERRNHEHPELFRKHRCKHKVHWDRAYRQLSRTAKRWLAVTGYCESEGHGSVPRYFDSYRTDTGNGFLGRYQFSPPTAHDAGFTVRASRAYFREQDVRAWRWRLRSSARQWPRCAAW